MTKIIGQIESLKQIRTKLTENGITEFNSIKDIKVYLSNFKSTKKQILIDAENDINDQILHLSNQLTYNQEFYEKSRFEIGESLNTKISSLINKVETLQTAQPKFILTDFFKKLQIKSTEIKRKRLEKNYNKIVEKKTSNLSSIVQKISQELDELTLNKDSIIANHSKPKISNALHIKNVLESINPLIAGAIGENLVVKELEKLSDDYILFNDFSLNFNPPVYNRKNNDRIFSIQIDHLLITHAGIFILETKNWSKKSIKNLDLRSPIEQIRRTNFALFVLLSNASEYNYLSLNNHHWGEKHIPIRNVVVMINEKPNEEFKYVKIKTLNELNIYINYFEPIFTQSEIKRISEYLRNIIS